MRRLAAQLVQSKSTKTNYPYRAALLAPPIIFQQRASEQVDCPYSYSSDWVKSQHSTMLDEKCARTVCADELVNNQFSVMSCKGPGMGKGSTYFGLNATRFHGDVGCVHPLTLTLTQPCSKSDLGVCASTPSLMSGYTLQQFPSDPVSQGVWCKT